MSGARSAQNKSPRAWHVAQQIPSNARRTDGSNRGVTIAVGIASGKGGEFTKSKSEFWINRLNYSLFFMPQNVFRRMHAKCNALAQTSFESTRKHTKFMKHLFFPLGRHRSGRRHGRGLGVGVGVCIRYACACEHECKYKHTYIYVCI